MPKKGHTEEQIVVFSGGQTGTIDSSKSAGREVDRNPQLTRPEQAYRPEPAANANAFAFPY